MTEPGLEGKGRLAPWLEGGGLFLLILIVMLVGGETVRASYHGYLHTTLGEAVLREGLTPENPYHAGAPLRYYTLYPALGVVLGRTGMGPLWGFVALNLLAALLTPVALDALGRSFRLSFGGRRAAFWAMVLGFNALGWIGYFLGEPKDWGNPPMHVLKTMTFVSKHHALGWDSRLQCFLPKFFNASSFVCAIPFGLWALAAAARAGTDRERSAWRSVLPAGLALAINPLVGAFSGACMAMWVLPTLLRGEPWQRLRWPLAGAAAVLLSTPFLLAFFSPAPTGNSHFVLGPLHGSGMTNFLGPMLLMAIPGALGLWAMEAPARWRIAAAVALAGVGSVASRTFDLLPFGNDYKLVRLAGILWALPVGVWAVRAWAAGGWRRALPAGLALVALPTTLLTLAAYLTWEETMPLTTQGGRLVPNSETVAVSIPDAIFEAEAAAPDDAVVVIPPDPRLLGLPVGRGMVQGHPLTALLHHPLAVDYPQFHNDRHEGLVARLDFATALWLGETSDAGGRTARPLPRDVALEGLREMLPDRTLLVILRNDLRGVGLTNQALRQAGGSVTAEAGRFALWTVPPLRRAAGS